MTNPRGRIQLLSPTPRPPAAHDVPPLVKPAHHRYYEVVICYAGEAQIVGSAATYRLRRGDALLVAPGAWHYESYRTAGRPYRLCWLIEAAQWVGSTFSTYARGAFDVRVAARAPMLEQHVLLVDLAREAREQPPHWEARTRAVLTELLVEMDRRLRHAPTAGPVHELDPVWRLLRIVETRFREPLQLKTLAAEVGMSEDYLGRRFRATHRTTFKHYLHTIRIHHAQLLLRSGWSVKQAATECGFSDQYYFNRVFKQLTRTTPGRFRRKGK